MDLQTLANDINRRHTQAETARSTYEENAKAAGRLLFQVKAYLPHGEFRSWIAKNCDFSHDTAYRYLSLSLGITPTDGGDLSDDLTNDSQQGGDADKPHVAHNSGNNEWYTPEHLLSAARDVLGGITLDPASSELANELVQADDFFTADDDGLSRPWAGRIWMNPPYEQGLVDKFVDKLLDSDFDAAVTLTNNATETAWGGKLLCYASAVCFLKGRVRFLAPDGEKNSPLQGQMLCYFGPDKERFSDRVDDMGAVFFGYGQLMRSARLKEMRDDRCEL